MVAALVVAASKTNLFATYGNLNETNTVGDFTGKLPSGGRLMVAEPMRLPQGQGEVVDPYFHFYLLAMGAGRLRSPQEIAQLLQQSGFTGVEQVPTAMPIHAQIVTAQKIGVNPND